MVNLSRWALKLGVAAVMCIACAQLQPPPTPTPDPEVPVDATTLARKVMFGYRGWFGCPGEGSQRDGWQRWFLGGAPVAAAVAVDLWPDTSELRDAERCVTELALPDGSGATVFSSFNPDTVDRHFEWMKEYGLDGVFLERPLTALDSPALSEFRNQVARNVRDAAENHGRVFAIMYDIIGGGSDAADAIRRDWTYLVDILRLTESPRYLQHDGKPVLGIRGLGYTATQATPKEAMALADYLREGAEPRYKTALVGGVPVQWRTLTGESRTDRAWTDVYRSFDVISPWTVGSYGDETGDDIFKRQLLIPDVEEAAAAGAGYMAVVWPGLSRRNATAATPLNSVPRNGGHFYWRQVHNAISAAAAMLYVASFDGLGDGTAMFKLAQAADKTPAEGLFVTLNADGFALPGDWYLRLGGETGKALRGEIPLSPDLPMTPVRPARDTGSSLRIEYKSTSDWTTLDIEGSNAIVAMEIVETQGEPTRLEADHGHLALGQSLYGAQSGRTVGITVKYTLDPGALEDATTFLLQKGPLGRIVLRVIKFTYTGARVLREMNLTVTQGEGVDTPLPIFLDRLLD
jgi:hypothetical protein